MLAVWWFAAMPTAVADQSTANLLDNMVPR
jgi:hypothetical protein